MGSPGRGAEGPGGSLRQIREFGGGGGLNIFFRGRNVHQDYMPNPNPRIKDNEKLTPNSVSSKSCSRKRCRQPTRMRQKCVNNASEARQKGSCFIGERGTFQNASEMRQTCVKNARNTFGGEHLWTIPTNWSR